MDTRIPLMVNSPDFAGSMMNGLTAGGAARDAQRLNALTQLYQTQGPQIMSGDPAALNSLARVDPNAAIGVQQTQLGMQNTRQGMAFDAERMQIMRDQAKAAVAEHAAKISADQLASEAAQTEAMLRGAAPLYMAMQQGLPGAQEKLLGYLAQNGLPADPSNIDALMYASQGALEGMKAYADLNKPKGPSWQPATAEQAAQYGAAGGQIDTTTGKFDPINPPSGMSITTNPDGTMSFVQGAGAGKPLTEAEGKNTGFMIRMRSAGDTLDKLESQGTDLGAALLAKDPTGLANYAQSPEFQMYDQAKRDFINAILRRESGAAIAPSEFANAELQYFPVPGDNPEVIAQKRKNRQDALAGVTIGAGTGAANPMAQGGATTGTDFANMDAAAMVKVDVTKLNADQLAAFIARLQEVNK